MSLAKVVIVVVCRGGSWGFDWGAITPLRPTKVTLFTMMFYNSDNSTRNLRPFCRVLFCHSSVAKYTFITLNVAMPL